MHYLHTHSNPGGSLFNDHLDHFSLDKHIYNQGSVITLNSVTFSDNEAPSGAGVYATDGATATLVNSTFSRNSGNWGGGVLNSRSSVTLRNVTMVGNIGNTGSSFYSDTPVVSRLENTILHAGNANECVGSGFSGNNNRIDDSSCGGLDNVRVTFIDTTLRNGLHALLPGSNAIDTGTCLVNTDQRGVSRPLDGDGNGIPGCDIGAYEYDGPAATATPTPTFTPVANFSVSRVEVSQAIQRPDNSVPLVRGRPSVARVYVESTGFASIQSVEVNLHGTSGGADLPGSPRKAENQTIPPNIDAEKLNDTVNFTLPESWLSSPTLTLRAEVNPQQTVHETDFGDNVSAATTLTVTAVPALEIVLIPIAYQHNGQGQIYTPTINTGNIAALIGLRNTYPVPSVKITLHEQYYFSGDFTPPQPGGTSCASRYGVLLRELAQLRAQEHPEQAHPGPGTTPKYVGILPVEATCGGGLSDSAAASLNWVDLPFVVAHEVGHNLGLKHPDSSVCDEPADNPDPNYPHANASIGYVGLDVFQMKTWGATTSRDLMSYCWPKWISDYHYMKMMDVLTSPGLVAQNEPSVSSADATPVLLVSGEIAADGLSGILSNAIRLDTSAIVTSPGAGDYTIRLKTAADTTLFAYAFMPVELSEGVNLPKSFGFNVPALSGLDHIELWRQDQLLGTLLASTTPQISANVSFQPGGQAFTVNWSASGTAQASVTLRYSADGGSSWRVLAQNLKGASFEGSTAALSASSNGLLEVKVVDRTSEASRVLELGPITDKAPAVGIDLEDPLRVQVNQAIHLTALGFDFEDGALPESAFTWTDTDGKVLGTGSQLELANGLPFGEHTFRVTVKDSANNSAGDTITIQAGDRLYLPSVSR